MLIIFLLLNPTDKSAKEKKMILNLMDRSLYFKGLLILSKIDKLVSYEEKEILKIVGESLGFNNEFCDTTINDVINNKYIRTEPLKFSNQQFAHMFLRDANHFYVLSVRDNFPCFHTLQQCTRFQSTICTYVFKRCYKIGFFRFQPG